MRIPYVTYYAYREELAVRESDHVRTEQLFKAFSNLMLMMDLYTDGNLMSKVSTHADTKLIQKITTDVDNDLMAKITALIESKSETAKVSVPYATFLSYNGEDRNVVEKIAIHLADNAQLRPWFDRWTMIPGEPWVRNLERGLQGSSSCTLFIGKSGKGPWQNPEFEVALRQQVRDPHFRVIPVLLPDAPQQPELPAFLSGITWIDFRGGSDDDDALWRLECAIRGVPPGRGRPNRTPKERRAHIFISYRHQEPDSSLAHTCADALEQAGHEVFLDTGLRWGAVWVRESRTFKVRG